MKTGFDINMLKWDSSNIRNLEGKVVIVTGGNSGIGFETARALAARKSEVIVAVRNRQKGEDAVKQIKAGSKDVKVGIGLLDLADLSSVHEFSEAFKQKYTRLDLLINNGGVMIPPYGKTADGFELQFGTNHLGHFSLTGLLFDLIRKTPGSRIVTVSSNAHRRGNLDFNDLDWGKRRYIAFRAYGDSKLANLYFTYELARRTGANPIVAAAHPGWTATELQRYSSSISFLNKFFAQDSSMGALPTLYAASAPDVVSGDYFGPSGFMEMRGYPAKVASNRLSHDKDIAAELWEVSQNLTGVKFLF